MLNVLDAAATKHAYKNPKHPTAGMDGIISANQV